MKRVFILALIACFPALIQAADLPNVVNQNNATNRQMCIDRATNDCINTICINSPDINCTDSCKSKAQSQCLGMQQ